MTRPRKKKGDIGVFGRMVLEHATETIEKYPPRPEHFSSIFGKKTPQSSTSVLEYSNKEKYWIDRFQNFTEIQLSLEMMKHAAVFISHFPARNEYRFHKITEGTWLRYHIESFLQEEYILYKRLEALLRTVQRTARRRGDTAGEKIACSLLDYLESAFEPIITTRGSHVHKTRYHDDELRDLDTIIFISQQTKEKKRHLSGFRNIKRFLATTKMKQKLSRGFKSAETVSTHILDTVADVVNRCEPTR